MVSINIDKLLKKFLPKLLKAFKIDYSVGSAVGITNAKLQGKETSMNPLNLTKKDEKAFIDNIETLIRDVDSDTAKKISFLTNKSITDRWSTKMLGEQLKDLFNKEVPGHFTYKNRFEVIAQDMSFDLMSVGNNNTALRLGAIDKWIFNVMDGKTADDSKVSHAKYGNESKAIPVDEPFTYTYKGKERTFMFGRDRPRDRSMTMYTFEDKENA